MKRTPFLTRLDHKVSAVLPGWIIGLLVALALALVPAVVVGAALALITLDLAALWGVAARTVFAVASILFSLILWTQS